MLWQLLIHVHVVIQFELWFIWGSCLLLQVWLLLWNYDLFIFLSHPFAETPLYWQLLWEKPLHWQLLWYDSNFCDFLIYRLHGWQPDSVYFKKETRRVKEEIIPILAPSTGCNFHLRLCFKSSIAKQAFAIHNDTVIQSFRWSPNNTEQHQTKGTVTR